MPFDLVDASGHLQKMLAISRNGSPSLGRFSADSKSLFVSAVDAPVVMFETKTLKEIRRFEGHQVHSRAMLWNKDASRLYSGDAKGHVFVHEIATGKLLNELDSGGESVRWLDLSSDESRLAVASSRKGIRMIELASEEHQDYPRNYYFGVFTEDEKSLFTYGYKIDFQKLDPASGNLKVLFEDIRDETGTLL